MSWQKILAQGFSSAEHLLDFLELPRPLASEGAEQSFASRIPLGFAQRMEKGNPKDPLLLQVLAAGAELEYTEGYTNDPLQELEANPLKGLIHKYHGRVLLTLTGACAVNCRFCFRRHFPYQDNNPGRSGLSAIVEYIAKDPSISEVILSGGDPLLASNVVFFELIQQLEGIPHLHTLRFHTRVPIVLPERIDAEFLHLLQSTTLKKVLVMHCNHPQELQDEVKKACDALKQVGCHLLNQSVLLSGINDKAEILAQLSRRLFDYGIMPYYLHVLDKVQGTAHFDVNSSKALAIYEELQALLPGYLVPKMAREESGKPAKTLLI